MPYNTRHKSLSLPSLGIHIPGMHSARAVSATHFASPSKTPARHSASSAAPHRACDHPSHTPESHHSKRFKRSHDLSAAAVHVESIAEQTPPPSPQSVSSSTMSADSPIQKDILDSIRDDIVEASIQQLIYTDNRPHLIKELAVVLAQKLPSVQQSANPCAIISSRLSSYMKRPCWSVSTPCPLAKELETVHPRRTYFFLISRPRQPLPDASAARALHASIVTPSVSLTDDSGTSDAGARRMELSPSPEVDLASTEFDTAEDDDMPMPMPVPVPPYIIARSPRYPKHGRDSRRHSPPLEKDEREFTQTADVLQKRKLSGQVLVPCPSDGNPAVDCDPREDLWLGDATAMPPASTMFFTSPTMEPCILSNPFKDDETDLWFKLQNRLIELDQDSEDPDIIEIDELDGLLQDC
ncbi:hypothetical protein CDD81_7053 [Ophiocordyceps australis]|uniref:GDS1 winged helix domain-containing protein n=1 Tax=Ophiocordyceps australis TaxID=1399860 RepID=A0A2C5XLS2_9HYPO|nr:hypothetical protein CDD81_7053 [Ophiocordyceps australis]